MSIRRKRRNYILNSGRDERMFHLFSVSFEGVSQSLDLQVEYEEERGCFAQNVEMKFREMKSFAENVAHR